MTTINIAIVGLGTVGSGLVTILNENADHILKHTNVTVKCVSVIDRSDKNKGILPKSVEHFGKDPLDIPDNYDVLVETMGGTDLAFHVCKMALSKGKSVVTANKAMLALHGKELAEIAEKNNAQLRIEASIGGGIPVVKTIKETFVCSPITKVEGILNGSCNYILTQMESKNISYEDALKDAQAKGYAESNPSLDVDGIDTAHKINVLAKLAFGQDIKMEDMGITGISHITLDDVNILKRLGMKIKLIATTKKVDDEHCICNVRPTIVCETRPFSDVNGTMNLVKMYNDTLEEMALIGHGAGMKPTGNAILCDILDIAQGGYHHTFSHNASDIKDAKTVADTSSLHYLVRLNKKIDDDLIEKEFVENNIAYALTISLNPESINELFKGNIYYELHEPLQKLHKKDRS